MTNPDIYNTMVGLDLVPITPNDSVDLPTAARAIRCTGTGGTLRMVTIKGSLRNTVIAANEVLIVGAVRVHATGTAATGLEAII